MGMGKREVTIPLREIDLEGELEVGKSGSLVIFAHGSGSSRHSPRNQFVARTLREAGMGTLLFDLLTAEEEMVEERTAHLRFNIPLLAERLVGATRWVLDEVSERGLRIGYFGASTGAAAALVAAAQVRDAVGAVVSRGGRPDLAGDALEQVTAPTLLIVGGDDRPVIPLNEQAYAQLQCEKEMRIVRGASHLFEESGTLETVAVLAAKWFADHLERV
jgi:pimeloyl-ACP methyl ester carboxylesterase